MIKKCLELFYDILERQIKIDKDWAHMSILQYALGNTNTNTNTNSHTNSHTNTNNRCNLRAFYI